MLKAAGLRLVARGAARRARRGSSQRQDSLERTAAGGVAGRGARAARGLFEFLHAQLGTEAARSADRRGFVGAVLRWAGVTGSAGRSEVCEKTARAAGMLAAAALPGILEYSRGVLIVRLHRFLRFAAGLAEVASVTPDVLSAAWVNAQKAAEPAQSGASAKGTIFGRGSKGSHGGRSGPMGSAASSDEARTDAASGLGCASPSPAEEAGAGPATPPASADDARDGSAPGRRGDPFGEQQTPTASRWARGAPAYCAEVFERLHELNPGTHDLGPVADVQPFLALARQLLERLALADAELAGGEYVYPTEAQARALAGDVRRVHRAGRLRQIGGRWTVQIAANPVLKLEDVESVIDRRPVSARMQRCLERMGAPARWIREMGQGEAERLFAAIGLQVERFRCPRLDARAGRSYRWRTSVVSRRPDQQHSLRAKILALGLDWARFEAACRAGAAAAPDVETAVLWARYTGVPHA
jgi:hypothetical protein